MMIERRAIPALRVFLVVLFGVVLVFQTLSIPGGFRYMAEQSPQDAALRWPATLIAGFWLLCVQVVIAATWQLLTRVKQDRIFSESSMRWVDVIIVAIGAGWVVLVAVDVFVLTQADDPGMPMVLLLLTTIVTVGGLLVLVLRALLRQATSLRTDLDAVI